MNDQPPPFPTSESLGAGRSAKELRLIVLYSLLAGLCPLIPIPFLDDWTRDLLRKRLGLELGRRHGCDLTDEEGEILACGVPEPMTAQGCFRGCVAGVLKPAAKLLLKLFRKIYRKVLVFLALKECVDTFSRTFHEGYLIDHALRLGSLATAGGEDRKSLAIRLRRAVEEAVAGVDPRPVEQLARRALTGSRRLLRTSAARLGRLFRRLRRDRSREKDWLRADETGLGDEEDRLEGLVDTLTENLRHEGGYLDDLEDRFRRAR